MINIEINLKKCLNELEIGCINPHPLFSVQTSLQKALLSLIPIALYQSSKTSKENMYPESWMYYMTQGVIYEKDGLKYFRFGHTVYICI